MATLGVLILLLKFLGGLALLYAIGFEIGHLMKLDK